ncbi:MAG TPA: methylated-DNA--[protein]-cysteine S-methyltransferase [Candidatus Limnocylindria bacterium]|nr:methylated-DNA--[protein]-cysteine S-methyltransferase [Candidatus Limnocylindria bacterium]
MRTWNGSVYAVVRMIPKGKVATYGQIATLLGRPRGGREVGWALSACDDPRVPCHRVVDRNGRLAPHFREQRARLRSENVTVSGSHVDLQSSTWRPSPRASFAIDRETGSR